MDSWSPDEASIVVFDIDASQLRFAGSGSKSGMTVEERDKLRGAFYRDLGLPNIDGHQRMRIDDPRWPRLLRAILDLPKKNNLALKSAWIEEPVPMPGAAGLWFQLFGSAAEFKSPKRTAANVHFASRSFQRLASERFKASVESAGLTGLAWLPLVECRSDDPVVWYEVFAEHPIGRGLDHALLDPAVLSREQVERHPSRRWGEEVAWRRQFRSNVTIANPIMKALMEMDPPYFRVNGPPRFVKEHLPKTDFAYSRWGFDPDTGPGAGGRPIRRICCNDRARRALIDARVLKPSNFEAVVIVPAAEARSEVLDRTINHPIPPPIYTQEEAAAERATRQAAIKAKGPEEPELALSNTDEAERYLRSRIADGTASWVPLQESEELSDIQGSELFKRTPEAWRRLVPLLPFEAESEDEEVGIVPPDWNDWMAYEPGTRDPEDEPCADDLIIARTMFGDWYAFRKNDPLLPRDARIVHWNHETTSIHEEWPNVAAFAAHIVRLCDAARDDEGE